MRVLTDHFNAETLAGDTDSDADSDIETDLGKVESAVSDSQKEYISMVRKSYDITKKVNDQVSMKVFCRFLLAEGVRSPDLLIDNILQELSLAKRLTGNREFVVGIRVKQENEKKKLAEERRKRKKELRLKREEEDRAAKLRYYDRIITFIKEGCEVDSTHFLPYADFEKAYLLFTQEDSVSNKMVAGAMNDLGFKKDYIRMPSCGDYKLRGYTGLKLRHASPT